MDREVVEQKLESLRRCIMRINEKCPPTSKELSKDQDIQDILSLNLTRAVQLSVDIGTHIISGMDIPPPNTMGQTFDILVELNILDTVTAIQLKKAVGFRNIAVHNYETINWDIVYAIATEYLKDFTCFAKSMIKVLEND